MWSLKQRHKSPVYKRLLSLEPAAYIFILLGWLISTTNVFAARLETNYPTDQEISALPAYCHAKLRADQKSDEAQHWKRALGKDYIHVHHLCAARAFLMRANRMDDNRHFYLGEAMNNLEYMITHSSPNFILMPEILYYKAYIFYKQKKYDQAIKYAEMAIKKNKQYIRPYLLIADIYIKLNDVQNAETIITDAKAKFPKSKAIKRRIKKIRKLKKQKKTG